MPAGDIHELRHAVLIRAGYREGIWVDFTSPEPFARGTLTRLLPIEGVFIQLSRYGQFLSSSSLELVEFTNGWEPKIESVNDEQEWARLLLLAAGDGNRSVLAMYFSGASWVRHAQPLSRDL